MPDLFLDSFGTLRFAGGVIRQHAGADLSTYNPLATSLQALMINTPPMGSAIYDESEGAGDARPVQRGRCYVFDGVDDYIALPHLTGAETVVSHSGTGTASVAAGRLDCTAGTLWNVTLSDGTFLKCDEQAGTTAYDSSGSGNHGTIMNATLETFHGTQDVVSWQNDMGYSDGTGGVKIPRNEAVTTQDVLGNPLQYSGRVPYNASFARSHCVKLDGVDDYIDVPISLSASLSYDISFRARSDQSTYASIIGARDGRFVGLNFFVQNGVFNFEHNSTILVSTVPSLNQKWRVFRVTWDGNTVSLFIDGVLENFVTDTSPVSVTANMRIGARSSGFQSNPNFNGEICDLLVNLDGTEVLKMPMAEGAGTTIYDVSGNGNHGTAFNVTESAFWGVRQGFLHWNVTKGYTPLNGVKVPALADGTADALGNAIGAPSGTYHNGAETLIDFTGGVVSPAAVQGAWETAWAPFDALTNPLFRRTLTSGGTPIRADRFLAFPAALSGDDLTDAQIYTATEEL